MFNLCRREKSIETFYVKRHKINTLCRSNLFGKPQIGSVSEHFPHKLCLSTQSIQPPQPPTPKQTGRHYSTSVCPWWPHCDDDVIEQSAESWSDKWVLSLLCIGLSQRSSVWQNTATLTSRCTKIKVLTDFSMNIFLLGLKALNAHMWI